MQDYPVGNGTGLYQSSRLFSTKQNHAAVLPLDVLMRESDFREESPRGKFDECFNIGLILGLIPRFFLFIDLTKLVLWADLVLFSFYPNVHTHFISLANFVKLNSFPRPVSSDTTIFAK